MSERTAVSLTLHDERGNVTVAVDGAAFPGTLREVPGRITRGHALEVVLIVGDEPVSLFLTPLSHVEATPGARVKVQLSSLQAGGATMVPQAVGAGVGLQGALSDVPPAELVQLLCATRRITRVDLFDTAHRLEGTLHFVDGRATHAETVSLAGEEAFYALAGLEHGRFEVRYGVEHDTQNLTGDTLFLLLESARRADEARREDTPFPGPAPTPELARQDDEDDAVLRALSPMPSEPSGPAEEAPALRVVSAKQASEAIARASSDAASKASSTSMQLKAKQKSEETPPALPRRRRRSSGDAPGEQTRPGRRSAASGTGTFSGFFEEFSKQRGEQAQRRSVGLTEVPRVDATDDEGLLSAPPTDDLVGSPAFSSLRLTPPSADPLDRDTDIMERASISAG